MKQLDILGKLFGSLNRVKIMRFFLLNHETPFSIDDIIDRLRLRPRDGKEELVILARAGFIKPKIVTKTVVKRGKSSRKKFKGFVANPEFALSDPLRSLLVDASSMHLPELPARFAKAGKVNLFIVSGIFIQDTDRTMDLMIVGDRLDKKLIERKIKEIESEIGKELRYAIFETPEFMYRLKMYDKLLRDVLDYPHEKLVSKIDHPELRR
jgi:hypothetical protein